jgi:hypothetical protein
MNWTQRLQRLMGAVIFMVACFVASPAAYAHGGHEPADGPAVSSNAAPVIDAAMPIKADRDVPAAIEVKVTASPAIPASKRCTGGCCTSSHACCAVTLPFNAGALAVPYTRASLALIEPPFRDGLDPEALRKPPRSLA